MNKESSEGRGAPHGVRAALVLSTVALVVLAAVAGYALPAPSPVRAAGGPLQPGDLDCSGGTWNTTHLLVAASGCQAVFSVEYAPSFSSSNLSGRYNFSFAIPWIAEVTPQGNLVQAASPMTPFYSHSSVTGVPGNVNVTIVETMNVTSGSGVWAPSDVWAGTGTGWNVSNHVVGATSLIVMFYLVNGTLSNSSENSSLELEFDVNIVGWPWVSQSDSLGFALSALSAAGSHFRFNTTTDALAENWNTTNTTFASLVFGPSAQVTYPSSTSASATVGTDVGLFTAGTADRGAMALATFGGVAGNYSRVSYDPLVVFSPTVSTGPPSTATSPASGFGSGVVVVTLVVAAVGLSTLIAVVARDARLRREGEDLVRSMQEAISRGGEPPHREP